MERTYTVRRISDNTPCITITGKWLRTLGIELGNKIRCIENEDCLILMKIPEDTCKREKQEKRLEELKQEMRQLEKEYQQS